MNTHFFLFVEIHEALIWLFYAIIAAGALAGALAAIYKVVKPIVVKCDGRWFEPVRQALDKAHKFDEKINKVQLTVESIQAEVKTNGGSSLKDAVNRIETQMEYTANKLKFRDQTMPQAVFEMDSNMNWLSVNRTLCELLNADATELLMRGWLTRIAPEIRQRVIGELRDAIENKNILDSRQLVLDDHYQQSFEIHVHAEPFTDRKENLLGFFGYVARAG